MKEERNQMSLGILCERFETDEMGIKLTAKELGIPLVYLPFRKIAVNLTETGYVIRSKTKSSFNTCIIFIFNFQTYLLFL